MTEPVVHRSIVRYHRHDFDLTNADDVRTLSNTLEASLQFSPTLDATMLEWAAERDRYKWLMARAVQDYVESFPEALRSIVRPLAIEHYAPLMKVEIATAREMLHTAESIPRGWESDERLQMLSFSHFTRLARIGDGQMMQVILSKIILEAQHARITCAYIDQLNASTKLIAEGATPPTINALLPTLVPARSQDTPRAQLQVEQLLVGSGEAQHLRKVIVFPQDDLKFEA